MTRASRQAKLSTPARALVALVAAFFCAAVGAAAQVPSQVPSQGPVQAPTAAEYAARLREASAAMRELASLCERLSRNEKYEVWSKGEADPDLALELPETERAAFDAAGRLPTRVRAPGAGAEVAVNNSWLGASLNEYKRLYDNEKKAAAARRMAERLGALEARLAEVGGEAVARDKDAEKGRLNAILNRPEYRQEAEQGGALQRLIDSIMEWVRDLLRQVLPESSPIRPGSAGSVSFWAQVLVIGLCLAVVAYVLRRLWLGRAQGTKREKKRGPRVILGERLEADKTAADLLEEAEGLARAGDLRGAIRKGYVALLCELGDRHVIRLAQHKTNRDYLRAVRDANAPRLYTEMLPLTYSFELHWYGLQDASESDWADFRARCRQAFKLSGV